MHQQGYNPQLRQYDGKGGATLYVTGMEHSPAGAIGTGWERTPWHATQRAAWEALSEPHRIERGVARCYPPVAHHFREVHRQMEQQGRACPQCSRAISPEDTIVFRRRLLGHLDCRRPRVLSAEERTLLVIYCRDHHVAECIRCARRFHLQEVASPDSFGVRTSGCRGCHTDLTDSIRAHLYGCAMLPVEVRRRAQAAREAARSLVKQSAQQHVRSIAQLVAETEAALHELRDTIRQAPTRSGTKLPGRQIRLASYQVLPMHLRVGDRGA
jgi:hypothetical protein